MKTKLSILALLALTLLVWAEMPPLPPRGVTMAWDYYDENPDAFKIYYQTNIAEPVINWMMLTNVPGTNREVTVYIVPGASYFFATASNFWGESLPSNTVSLPGLVGTNRLSIKR